MSPDRRKEEAATIFDEDESRKPENEMRTPTEDERMTTFAKAIAAACEKETLESCSFHLSTCHSCGCPSFQQPCALCGFYPMGERDWRAKGEKIPKERFVAIAEKAGGVAAWYCSSLRRTVAHSKSPKFREAVERLIEAVKTIPNAPTAAEIWKTVVEDGKTVSQGRREDGIHWSAIRELRRFCENVDAGDEAAFASATAKTIPTIVETIREGRLLEAAAALRDIAAEARTLPSGRLNGNLSAAIAGLDRFQEKPPAPKIDEPREGGSRRETTGNRNAR
jgi:hypothetical protein